MSYLAQNNIPAIGDKEFDAVGYNGLISTKSLSWLAPNHAYADWSMEEEHRLEFASVSNIAKEFVKISSMIVDKKYVNTHNRYCPRPRPQFPWFDNQTVIRKLDTKEMGGAILGDLSVAGYTRRHYHLSPTNVRVAETAPELSTIDTRIPPPISPERDLKKTHSRLILF